MAFRKCNKCDQVKSKELFSEGFTCAVCATKNDTGAPKSPLRYTQQSPSPTAAVHTPNYGTSPQQTAPALYRPTTPTYTPSAQSPVSGLSPLSSPKYAPSPSAPAANYTDRTTGTVVHRVTQPLATNVTAGGTQYQSALSSALGPQMRMPSRSPKWDLPKATLQSEFRTAFMILVDNFEAVSSGQSIGYHELFTQPRDHSLKRIDAMFGLSLMCDACTTKESTLTGDVQLFHKVYLCEACSCNEDIILKKRNNAAQHLQVQTKRCFDLADVNYSQTLDFLEYIHWSLELSSVIPCVPQKPILMFIKEIFTTYAEATDGKLGLPWRGVQSFFNTCFKVVPPNCEEIFNTQSKGQKTMQIWQFIRLLVSIFHPKCTYLEVKDRNARRGSTAPTFSFRQLPKAAKSFRNSIPKYDCSLLQKKRLLGKGGLCEAWLCNYKGNDIVAKIPLPSATPEEVKKMFRAARQQMKFDHENILRVLGVFEEVKPPTILLELAEGGDVSDLLIGNVDLPTQWRLAKEIAEALFCLHTHVPFPYAHRDLKGMNVFLTKDLHAKLADFDFLIEIPEGVLVSGLCGTPGYIAPEMLAGPGYDHRVDIWSYASLMYEITHSMNPYSKEVCGSKGPMSIDRWVPTVMEITLQGLRPQLNERTCPKKMRDLITDCWKQNADDRPTIIEIIERLDAMEKDFDP
eukprot:EG_transcript_4519